MSRVSTGVVIDVRAMTLGSQYFGDLSNIVRDLASAGVRVFIVADPAQRQPFNVAVLPAAIVTSDEAPSAEHTPHLVLQARDGVQ